MFEKEKRRRRIKEDKKRNEGGPGVEISLSWLNADSRNLRPGFREPLHHPEARMAFQLPPPPWSCNRQ